MKCQHCHVENREGAEFCRACGQSIVPSRVVCPKCGNENSRGDRFCDKYGQSLCAKKTAPSLTPTPTQSTPVPTSFANGRYQVKKFLGEGGKKKVYLAHDTVLDRDVAFALIKTEKLDEASAKQVKPIE